MCWIWLVQGLDCLFFVAQCDNCVHFCFSCIVRTCLNNPNDTGSECEWNFVATDLQPVSWPSHLPKPFRKYKETENKEFKPIRKPYSMFTQENKLIYLCRQNGNPSVSCSQWPPLHHRRVHGTVRKDLRKYIKKNKPGPKVPYVSNRGGGHWLYSWHVNVLVPLDFGVAAEGVCCKRLRKRRHISYSGVCEIK